MEVLCQASLDSILQSPSPLRLSMDPWHQPQVCISLPFLNLRTTILLPHRATLQSGPNWMRCKSPSHWIILFCLSYLPLALLIGISFPRPHGSNFCFHSLIHKVSQVTHQIMPSSWLWRALWLSLQLETGFCTAAIRWGRQRSIRKSFGYSGNWERWDDVGNIIEASAAQYHWEINPTGFKRDNINSLDLKALNQGKYVQLLNANSFCKFLTYSWFVPGL